MLDTLLNAQNGSQLATRVIKGTGVTDDVTIIYCIEEHAPFSASSSITRLSYSTASQAASSTIASRLSCLFEDNQER